MKITVLLLFIGYFGFSQSIEYGKAMKGGNYTIYRAKNGEIVKVNDSIHINTPKTNTYKYITYLGTAATTAITNKKFKITRIKAYYNKRLGPLVLVAIIGKGLHTTWIDYENAVAANEVSITN